MRADTFTAADVVITTLTGVIPATQLSVHQVSPLVLDVHCPPQTALGLYQVQVGPHISDLYGNEMGYTATSTFTLTPLTLTVSLTTTHALLQWPTGLGRSYQPQSATSLSGASWQNYDVPVAGTGGVVPVSFPIGAETQRFFRVLVQ